MLRGILRHLPAAQEGTGLIDGSPFKKTYVEEKQQKETECDPEKENRPGIQFGWMLHNCIPL